MVQQTVLLLVALGDQATLGPMHEPRQDWHTLPEEPRQDWHKHPFPLWPAPQQNCHWAAGSSVGLLAVEQVPKVLSKKQVLEMPEKEPMMEALMKVPMASTSVVLALLHAPGSTASAEAGASEFVLAISPILADGAGGVGG